MIAYSVLDLCPITDEGSAAQAFANSVALARLAEASGYRRFWLAEHHAIPGIASAATSVIIAHVAAATQSIRIGSGGIMLPNHAPLVIAEQFGTLEALFPGRIDLGLGRAPGGDQATARALRRTLIGGEERFPQEVAELQAFLGWGDRAPPVQAVPGAGARVPLWLLGSSTFGAQLAAYMGLPYAFAGHFAPGLAVEAGQLYRSHFRPSEQLDRPYFMLGLNVVAAPTDAEARLLATSAMQAFLNLRRGMPGLLAPPDPGLADRLTAGEAAMLEQIFALSAIGGPETVKARLAETIARIGPDEVMIAANIHDPEARLQSFRLAAEVLAGM